MNLLFFDLETWTKEQENIKEIWWVDFVYNPESNHPWEHNKIQRKNFKDYEEYINKFNNIILKYEYLVWHNILHHDLKQLWRDWAINYKVFKRWVIDTLYLSTLINIEKPYHRLLKDYKFIDKENDSEKDALKCRNLFIDCMNGFNKFPINDKNIYYSLLYNREEFKFFFEFYNKELSALKIYEDDILIKELNTVFSEFVDWRFDMVHFIKETPLEIAYFYRLLKLKNEKHLDLSVFPKWINHVLPKTALIYDEIRKYRKYDLHKKLKEYFWYDDFRHYKTLSWEEISQEEIIEDTLKWENILAILATWWGKSLTFQLPSLISAEVWSLSIVISPLQSLMKDQVDSLNKKDIQNVWFLNGLLNPLERKEVIEQIETGWVDILYVSPEMLRSRSTLRILEWRNIDRIIIDEAHCFSKWWHDFRPDYLFIWDFIKTLGEKNHSIKDEDWNYRVKISCFTATAKEEVTAEIKWYFNDNLWIGLKEYVSTVKRNNLHYSVYKFENESEKKERLISILKDKIITKDDSLSCIIFARTRRRTKELCEFINQEFDSEVALFYHGNLDIDKKRRIQNEFMKKWWKKIIVATNAFWMWIDKDNVRFVIHYEIPESLENYIQEAWRAGRDWWISQCIIFYTIKDIDENFRLQKRSEINIKQVKKLVQWLTHKMQKFDNNNTDAHRKYMSSIKQLILDSSWIDIKQDPERREEEKEILENKMKRTLYLLEKLEFIKRKFNHTRVFATSKNIKTLSEGIGVINNIPYLSDEDKDSAIEILKLIISWRIICIEEIPDQIWLNQYKVRWLINVLQSLKLIEKDNDVSGILNISGDKVTTSIIYFEFIKKIIEKVLLNIQWKVSILWSPTFVIQDFDRYELNTKISKELGKDTLIEEIWDIFNFLKNLKFNSDESNEEQVNDSSLPDQYAEMEAEQNNEKIVHWKYITLKKDKLTLNKSILDLKKKVYQILDLSGKVLSFCYDISSSYEQRSNRNIYFELSMNECIQKMREKVDKNIKLKDIEEALVFLHKIWVLKIQSGLFMYWTSYVFDKGLKFWKLFTEEDFIIFKDYYESKIRQVKYMQEYALMLADNNKNSESYLEDYFNYNECEFKEKYFPGRKDLNRPMTEEKYNVLIKELSNEQRSVLERKRSNELIIAWPWAGKTKTIVHKVASLILNDGVRNDEFLLLTFSRAAKFELKKRIIQLLWWEWYWLNIHTFHSYAYKLLWKEYKEKWDNENVIRDAINFLKDNDIQLPFSVIVLDEFQDINDEQYQFVTTIKEQSSKIEEMRVIATWDDDQNIYEFQGGNVKYIRAFENDYKVKPYFLTKNYRSNQDIIDISSAFITPARNRIKAGKYFVTARKETKELGKIIKIVKFNWSNYCNDIAYYTKEIVSSHDDKQTLWILCYTNEEALKLAHLLKKAWYNDVQIALKDTWYTLDLSIEFYNFINTFKDLNEVKREDIKETYEKLRKYYWENRNIKNLWIVVKELLESYKKIYYTEIVDFFKWMKESDLSKQSKIIVSTLHQAKGREFNSVILVFDENYRWNNLNEYDARRRLIYVGLTRAMNNLIVLWKDSFSFFNELYKIFTNKEKSNVINNWDWAFIDLVTWLKDVQLWYNHKFDLSLSYLPIWEPLEYTSEGLYHNWKMVIKFSKKIKEQLQQYLDKWYKVKASNVYQRIVYPLLNEYSGERDKVVLYLAIIWLRK